MTRRYRSTLRARRKAQTEEDIVSAALRLHGKGITDLDHVAKEAGVSLSTVRKHFPTKEDLFRGCTAHFRRTHPSPSLEDAAAIDDPGRRLIRVVQQILALNEALFGQSWLALRLQDESPTLAATVAARQAQIAAAADIVCGRAEDRPDLRGFVRAQLSPLTYRALRLAGDLNPDQALALTVETIAHAAGTPLPPDWKGTARTWEESR